MNDNEIEQHSKQALNESLRDVSSEVRQSLYESRRAALTTQKNVWFKQATMGLALAAGFAAILLVNYFPKQQIEPFSQHAHANIDDFMFLSTFDETDLEVAEDIEFTYWLSEQLENETSPEILSNSELRNG